MPPRVTSEEIESYIAEERYFTLDKPFQGEPDLHPKYATYTVCVLRLKNNFLLTGVSAPVSPENFDPALGRKYARQKALDQMWLLMGFALADRLHREAQ